MNKIISWISLFFSLIAISLFVFRQDPISFDWIAILIGILALLVTVLIGWQIFQIINIEKIRSEINNEKISFEKEKFKMMSSLCFEIAKTYYKRNTSGEWVLKCEENILNSIYFAVRSEDENTVQFIEESLNVIRLPLVGFTASERNKIDNIKKNINFKALKKIGNFQNVEDFLKL